MKTVRIQRNGETLASVWHATGYFARLRGLLGRTIVPGGGLLLTPCNAIHTIGMRYAIDAVYLDQLGRVLRADEAVKPGRVCAISRHARHVLELPEGSISRHSILPGERLEVTS
jgi:uncharacterized membrane protein (UPF0127 family)